jgi:hypothetical protein
LEWSIISTKQNKQDAQQHHRHTIGSVPVEPDLKKTQTSDPQDCWVPEIETIWIYTQKNTTKERRTPLEFAKSEGWIPLLETAEEKEEEGWIVESESYK